MDPFVGNSADPQSLHKYLYAHNDPIQNIDPTGKLSLGSVTLASGIAGSLIGTSLGAYIGVRETGTLFSLRTGSYILVGGLAGFGIGASTGALLYELIPLTTTGLGSSGALHNLVKVTPKIVQVVRSGPQTLFAVGKGRLLAGFIAGAATGGLSANTPIPEVVGFGAVGSTTAVSLLYQTAIRPTLNPRLALYLSGSIDISLSFTLGYLAGFYTVRGEQLFLENVVDAAFELL